MENNINYGKAIFSVAMIDFDNYIELLNKIDIELENPNFVLNYVLSKGNYEDSADLLKEHAFSKFAKIKCALDKMEKEIVKYQNRLEEFLSENEDERTVFDRKLDILIPLHEEKSRFVKAQIQKCFDYIKSNEYQENCEETQSV